MDTNIKQWYMNEFPNDELGLQLNDSATFGDVYKSITDVYDIIGVGDSIIRERVFQKLSEIMDVDYSFVYKRWLGKPIEFVGGWTLSNHGGVGVIEMNSDAMQVQYYDDIPQWCEIEYDEEGEAFIKVGQLELYLNECMRY